MTDFFPFIKDKSIPTCTGIGASWCPYCGRCECRYEEALLITSACPLHSYGSLHGDDVDEHEYEGMHGKTISERLEEVIRLEKERKARIPQ